uniref:Mannosyltransferase n=1 Tax=Oryza punctata TaxID=4537 RepID=A0A0E0KTF8_ORYPU
MAPPRPSPAARILREYGWDLLLGSIAAFYAVMVPYTKVEESFNVQAMHDILYHNYHIEKYDHLEFPGVVPRSFIVRIMLGSIILMTLRLLRVQVKRKFGHHAEAFYVILTATQFHLLFYSTRPLPNILALAFVNLTYYFWFKGNHRHTLQALTHSIHWYFTSALPRSMLVAYPLCMVGALLDRRIVPYILPVFSFVALYSKLPHKELRFIMASIPMLNVSASLAASRVYNNRKKSGWKLLYVLMIGGFLSSLGYSAVTFMASYNNYPGGYALKALHEADSVMKEKIVHIDAFTAMCGVSRFCESEYPWRYSKEEKISIEEYQERNFTYLLNEHRHISGYKCLFAVDGFSRAKIQPRIPPLSLVKEPKVFAHGNTRDPDILSRNWPGCP